MQRAKYRDRRLIHNPRFPLETSRNVIDQWIEASGKDDLAGIISGIDKRRFIASHVFEAGGERFRAKFYRTAGMKRRWEAFFVRPESIRNFRTSLRVLEAGLNTAEPLCVWGSWKTGLHEWSVLFMRDIGDLIPLPRFMDSLDPADAERKARVSLTLARELARLHDAKVYVYDPAKNVLVWEEGKEIKFFFIDFDTVKVHMRLTKRQVKRVLCHCIRPPVNPLVFTYPEVADYAREYLEARGLMKWYSYIQPRL